MSEKPYQMKLLDEVIVVTFCKGIKITPKCILEVIDQKNAQYDVLRLNALWDFRGALPSDDFGYDAIERIIHHIDNNSEAQWNPNLAILADAGVQYGLSRMFQTLAIQFPIEIQIFHEWDEAMKWAKAASTQGGPD